MTGGQQEGGDDPEGGDPDPEGSSIGATYTVQPCTPYQDALESYQRHKHPLGDGTDTGCHRHDNSHCPAGHTEHGGHGSGDCRKNDNPDTIFTRIQHLLEQGGKAALDAIVETLKNEATDQLDDLDIDWESFATDGDEQQKLLDVLNPVLRRHNVEVYTIDDVKNLWADIGKYGRAGVGNAACGIAVEIALARLTKGRSLKKGARPTMHIVVDSACAVGAAGVPVPGDCDGGAGCDSDDPPPVPGDTDGDGTVSDDEVTEAERRFENREIDSKTLNEIQRRRDCAQGNGWLWPSQGCEGIE